jgi:ubiquitin C-terminal hydrolase
LSFEVPDPRRPERAAVLTAHLPLFGEQFSPGRQEDSQEFLIQLLDNLEQCCIRRSELPPNHRLMAHFLKSHGIFPRTTSELFGEWQVLKRHYNFPQLPNLSPLSIFRGKISSSLTCVLCGHVSETSEPFESLSLEIPAQPQLARTAVPFGFAPSQRSSSVKECLDKFAAPETLDDDNMYQCDGCKQKIKAVKQLRVREAPQTLVVHLKRFRFADSYAAKDNTHVAFEDLLDLGPYCCAPTDGDSHANGPVYALTGVLVHAGASAHSGHYYCYIRPPVHSRWRDELIQEVTEKDEDTQVVATAGTAVTVENDVTEASTFIQGRMYKHCSIYEDGTSLLGNQWVLFDDERVSVEPDDFVKSKQAYMLFYDQVSQQDLEVISSWSSQPLPDAQPAPPPSAVSVSEAQRKPAVVLAKEIDRAHSPPQTSGTVWTADENGSGRTISPERFVTVADTPPRPPNDATRLVPSPVPTVVANGVWHSTRIEGASPAARVPIHPLSTHIDDTLPMRMKDDVSETKTADANLTLEAPQEATEDILGERSPPSGCAMAGVAAFMSLLRETNMPLPQADSVLNLMQPHGSEPSARSDGPKTINSADPGPDQLGIQAAHTATIATTGSTKTTVAIRKLVDYDSDASDNLKTTIDSDSTVAE